MWNVILSSWVRCSINVVSELLGDFLKKKPKETDGIDSVIVVDNIPQVEEERLEKLKNVIRKIFQKFGKIQNEHYPMNESGKTKGYWDNLLLIFYLKF